MPLDEASVARIDADLAVRHEDALQALDKAMCEPRYHKLLEMLLTATAGPQLSRYGADPAELVLPNVVSLPWRRFAYGANGVPGAGQLEALGSDESWHAARINGKRARYAVEAVASVLGGEAAALAAALGSVQDLLGEHQDAAAAAEMLRGPAHPDPRGHSPP